MRIPASSLLPILVVAVLGLPACGKGSSSASGTVTSVAITPVGTTTSPIDVPINLTTNFTAVVNVSGGTTSTSTTVTWEVNGVAGGSSTTGTIVASATDAQVGIFTAPAVVPNTNNGQVDITAVAPLTPGTTVTTGNTVTSNTSVVQVGVGNGLVITPAETTVPAGGTRQFLAQLNGVSDTNVTWAVSSANGGNIGNIDPQSGLYTAPNFPPPGGVVTITATDNLTGANTMATAQIVYSDLSFNGPFAFSYTGNDSAGFLAAAGSIVTDGSGHIVSGIEDEDSTLTGVSSELPITGTYTVGPDGRGSATISTGRAVETWQFVLTTNQHALLTRFDRNFTGSGTIDQQALPLTANDSQLDGPFVFGVSGLSTSFLPESVAGRFDAHGDGTIPAAGSIFDLNNNGAITPSASLQASTYGFDAANVGTGRGTITLNGMGANPHEFAFYVIDSSSSQGHLHLVEIDGNGFFAGDMYAGLAGGPFGVANLAAGNYAFTSGGTATVGMPAGPVAYAEGGVFTSDGNGNISSGELDSNIGGTADGGSSPLKPSTVNACPYTVDPTTGRIFLNLLTAAGACPPAPGAPTPQFALYQTALGSGVLIELDSIAVSVGIEFEQVQPLPGTAPAGNFAFALAGQGAFHNTPALFQPDVDGQFAVGANLILEAVPGNVDINNFNAVFKSDPLTVTGLSASTPDASGRGTLTFSATNPAETFDIVFYIVNANTALLLDTDTSPVATGSVIQQF